MDRTIVQGDGVDDNFRVTGLTSRSTYTRYLSVNPFTISSKYIVDGNVVDRQLIYISGSNLALYNSGTGAGELTISVIARQLNMFTGDYNTSSSKWRTNSGADVTGTIGNNASTGITIFSSGALGANANVIVNTLIDTIAVSNNTQKTAMYNYIRSINNNAF